MIALPFTVPWLKVSLAVCIGLAAALGWQTIQLHDARAAVSKAETAVTAEKAAIAKLREEHATNLADAEKRERAKGEKRVADLLQTLDESARRAAAARADAARADRAVAGLRERTAALAAAARRDTGADPSTAASCAPATAAADMLADVSGRLAEAGRQLADYAESAGNSAETCAGSYDAMRR